MIKKAKASLSSVQIFTSAATDAVAYSEKLNRGIACLEQMSHYLSERISSVKDCISKMEIAQGSLAEKKNSEEEIIARLTEQINSLEERLSELESDLAETSDSLTIMNEDGEETSIPNPAYLVIEAEIATIEGEIRAVELEMAPHQHRLERIEAIDNQIAVKIDSSNGIMYSLDEKRAICIRLQEQLLDTKGTISRKGLVAIGSLKKIKDVINQYLRTKMTYEKATTFEREYEVGNTTININININKTEPAAPAQENAVVQDVQGVNASLTKEYISEHGIKFNEYGHISEFEGRKYGGKYNTYDMRLGYTLLDDTLFGKYDGERGESKFVPSERTAEGVQVLKILESYKLDGIVYRNAEPDFEVCAVAVVKISDMSEHRDAAYTDAEGNRHECNFVQASIACAELWNSMKKDGRTDWDAEKVDIYRYENKLTWHEKADTETMVLVRTEINDFFKHSGGVSECKKRDNSSSNNGGGFDE